MLERTNLEIHQQELLLLNMGTLTRGIRSRGCPTIAMSGGFIMSSHFQQFELSDKEQTQWLLTWNVWCLVCFVIFIIKEHID